MELSPEELVIVVLIVFVCIVFLKAYAIGIVWRCYKYLTLRQQSMRTLLPLGITDLTTGNLGAEERAYSTLLPNYDEAVAQYMKQAPPPSYQVAMSNYQTEDERNNVPDNVPAAAEGEDNNNDSSNNNNTVHVNNNTPPMRRNENTASAAAAANNVDDLGAAGGEEEVPPSYNDVIIEPVSPGHNDQPANSVNVVPSNTNSSTMTSLNHAQTNKNNNNNESHA